MKLQGITIALCCHNSAARLPETLCHLRAQDVPAGLSWEVLLIDNGCTDDTVGVAQRVWDRATTPLRIVPESRLGLSHARHKALDEAAHPIICFVDDDNWLAPNWVTKAAAIMAEHPEVGACGGHATPAFTSEPPPWFERHQGSYATSPEIGSAADVTDNWDYLFGAGLVLRKRTWADLQQLGFKSILSDRSGAKLLSGGDVEICAALKLTGWRLWYDPGLRMKHYIPPGRLTWTYLCRLFAGFGYSNAFLELYWSEVGASRAVVERCRRGRARRIRESLSKLVQMRHAVVRAIAKRGEGDDAVLRAHYLMGLTVGMIARSRKENVFRQFVLACRSTVGSESVRSQLVR